MTHRTREETLMVRKLILCAAALASLGACSAFKQPREAASCPSGPRFALNADRWTPAPEDLAR